MKDFKEFFLMVNHPYELVLKLVFLRALNSRSPSFLDLHEWSFWWHHLKRKTLCWWHIYFLNISLTLIIQQVIWTPISRRYLNGLLNGKLSFNPDPIKSNQEVIFCRKMIKPCHPLIKLDNLPVQNASSQKHLGMIREISMINLKMNIFVKN